MDVRSAALLVAAMVAVPPVAQAPSASKVIERFLDASGGKDAVEKIASTEVSGRVTAGDGRSGTFLLRTGRPRLFSVSVSLGDVGWQTGFNGRAAWHGEGPDGVQTLYGEPSARVRADALFANTRYVPSDHLIEFWVRGTEQVRGRPTIAVVAAAPDAVARTLFFDAESNLLVKDEQRTAAGVDERFFDDYRRVDGVREPHRIEWHRNGQTFLLTVDRISHNTPLDAQLFDIPAARTDPPEDIAAVLSAVQRGEARGGEARAPYVYVQVLTSRNFDLQGNVTRTHRMVFDIFHLGGQPVARAIQRGGEALTEGERRRQEERVRQAVQEYERERASGRAARRPTAPLPSSLLFQLPPLLTAQWWPAYVRMSEFSHVRRERVGDRVALVVEFQPRRRVSPSRELEEQVGRMSGVLWIDDTSQQVIRVESFFTDSYNGLVPGSTMRMERSLVNGDAWLPLGSEARFRKTRGFAGPLDGNVTIEFSDYQKYGVTTDSTIALPDAGR